MSKTLAPISEAKMAKYVEVLELRADQRVLDVGCGCGEVLIRLCERYEIRGTGIDSSSEHIAEAKRRATGRASDSQIRFVVADAQTFHVELDFLRNRRHGGVMTSKLSHRRRKTTVAGRRIEALTCSKLALHSLFQCVLNETAVPESQCRRTHVQLFSA